MNLYKETIKIFQDYVTATTREKELRRLFRVVGKESSIPQAPLHSSVCAILKAKLSEHDTESKLKAMIGMPIETSPKDENQGLKALAEALRKELGLTAPQADHEVAQKAILARAYPSLLGPEPEPRDPLEGLNAGQREICETFYGSGETLTFGFQDRRTLEPIDPELEETARGLYPKMK